MLIRIFMAIVITFLINPLSSSIQNYGHTSKLHAAEKYPHQDFVEEAIGIFGSFCPGGGIKCASINFTDDTVSTTLTFFKNPN
ncbi:MAG: hypothetical protein K9N46_16545 [Candidatus Marinimicrobia bacterium]|nr:hypothetical protein [Candidatus Neomarinimicrobiota bacterium]MCF7829458.1 hypothetical protein [Candidatus Neomarinimicrobiota bacterium]MCF7882337.1 hypothetical protein [Candidatus Neomarinimicrobiota bacterium]